MKGISLLLLCVLVVVVVVLVLRHEDKSESTSKYQEDFSALDKEMARQALKELGDMLEAGVFPLEVSSEELMSYADNIYLAKVSSKEGLSYFPEANTRYWPYYYYSFPYNYKYGGAWPPGLFSRLYFWSPGFYTGTGWSYYMRPGMGFKWWPRNRWIRHTQGGKKDNYYYVTNRDDYTHNSSNYEDTPLRFHS